MMRNLSSVVFAAACVCLVAGCSTWDDVITDTENAITYVTPAATPSAAEVNSVAAATSLVTAADKVALPFMKTVACDVTCKMNIAEASHTLRVALDRAIADEQAGNSADEALAFAAFNAAYPPFLAYLASKGVTP